MRMASRIVVVAVFVAIPRLAVAQSPEDEAPPIVEPGPPALDARPMRFLLSTGAVVIGTRIGESATAIGVQTQTGIVTIQKADVVTMDYRVELGRRFDLQASRVPVARPAPPEPEPPPPTHRERRERPRHPGRAATVAGGIIFGLSYSVSCLGALLSMSMGDSNGAVFLAIPVVGPAMWAVFDSDQVEVALLLTGIEALGAALLVHGIVSAGQADQERPRHGLIVAPLLTADVQGLAVAGTL